MVLRVPEVCLWPADTWNKVNFLRCIFGLDLGEKMFKHKWNKLATNSFLLHCNGGYSWLVFQIEFSICVPGFNLNFSLIALLLKGLQLDSETDLTTNGLIFEFFDGIWFFLVALVSAPTEFCMSFAKVLIFWRRPNFSTVSLRIFKRVCTF